MKPFLTFSIYFFCILALSTCQESTETNTELSARDQGLQLVLDGLKALFIGGEDPNEAYKDIFIDTSKSVLSLVDHANEQITVDDLIRIFFQSLIILAGKRRPDLIPRDFNQRNKVFGDFISELNKNLEILLNKGSGALTMKELKPMIKIALSDEFWETVTKLNQEVEKEIELEELKEKSKKETKNQEL